MPKFIFKECPDQYGLCIRNYTFCALSLLIACLATYSLYRIIKRDRKVGFEQILLLINSITSFLIFGMMLFYDVFNSHIILLLVQFYSYFLISYGFFLSYVRNYRHQVSSFFEKSIKIVFFLVTGVILLAAITCTVLSFTGDLKCTEEKGVSVISILLVELPLYIITSVYAFRTRQKISQYLQKPLNNERSQQSYHLLEGNQVFFRQKVRQIYLIMLCFNVTMILHIVQLCLYLLFDQVLECKQNTNQIIVQNFNQLLILIIQNISELFPHMMIPLIFWYLPSKLHKVAQTVYINPKLITIKSED